jgi:hypothetical protein
MMANERADIFADDLNDLGSFKPKAEPTARPGPDILKEAGQGKFVSREVVSPPARKETWRYRTGRDRQFNTRASQDTIDGFNDLARQMNCPVAEAVERALHALRREIIAGRDGR